MQTVEEFLAYAICLEQEATLRFAELADAATTHGNAEVAAFFRKMSDYSRQHLEQARQRAGWRQMPDMAPGDFHWPGGESPEAAAIWGADGSLDISMALQLALRAERCGLAYYSEVLASSQDPEIKVMAREFVEEEAEHVAALERWVARVATA